MYCDPKIYNFSNLDKTHQVLFGTMLDQTLYSIYCNYREYVAEAEISDTTLEKISYEEKRETAIEILNSFLENILDAMITTLDNHCDDWEVNEIDTNNHFYGYKLPEGLEELVKETSFLHEDNCAQ